MFLKLPLNRSVDDDITSQFQTGMNSTIQKGTSLSPKLKISDTVKQIMGKDKGNGPHRM